MNIHLSSLMVPIVKVNKEKVPDEPVLFITFCHACAYDGIPDHLPHKVVLAGDADNKNTNHDSDSCKALIVPFVVIKEHQYSCCHDSKHKDQYTNDDSKKFFFSGSFPAIAV